MSNLFELAIILMALFYSNFAKLPLMVTANIVAFTLITFLIEVSWEVTLTPGYEIYHMATGLYFLCMAGCFFIVRNHFFKVIAACLMLQSIASCMMLFNDNYYMWHEWINEKMLIVECVLVWLSSVRCKNEN